MVRLNILARHPATLAGDEPKNSSPAPASVIFEVEAKMNGRSRLPA
jgi:hypothetical protein